MSEPAHSTDDTPTPDTYVHGHHESVLRSHLARTVENSAGYLVPHLAPGASLLDVGCGPGTITVELARRLAPGAVVGIDLSQDVIDAARALDAPANCRFQTGDSYALQFDDDHFDVVHAHQVLQHLRRPVDALAEMRRVVRPGGVIAARDADYAAMHWAPASPALDRWLELYHQICDANQVEADAGRHLLGWAQRAGFDRIEVSASSWAYATPDSRAWWSDLWADRITQSTYAQQAVAHGLATPDELETIATGFRSWADAPDGVFVVPSTEILAFA